MIFELFLAAAAAQPSFDCARARTQVEHAICASDELSALDREEARLYRIALRIPQARRQQLLARQRQFLRDRDSCSERGETLSQCVRDAYLWDIGDLRRIAALEDDNEGISSGPNRFRCNGGYPDVYLTLFDTSPAQGNISVPALNEGQPLVADVNDRQRLVGRYATDMVYDPRTREVRLGNTICTPGE